MLGLGSAVHKHVFYSICKKVKIVLLNESRQALCALETVNLSHPNIEYQAAGLISSYKYSVVFH